MTSDEMRAEIRRRDRGDAPGPDLCVMPGWVIEDPSTGVGSHGGIIEVHHRVRRSQGGRDVCWNLISLCSVHHKWVHANPYAARRLGYLLPSHSDPAKIPLDHTLWPAGPVLLGEDLTFQLWAS